MKIQDMVEVFIGAGLQVSEHGTKVFDAVFVPSDLADHLGYLDMVGEEEIPEDMDRELEGWTPVAAIEIDTRKYGIAQGYIRACLLVWDTEPKDFKVYKSLVS